MRNRLFFIFVLIAVIFTGCIEPNSGAGYPISILDSAADFPHTPTPFLPVGPTPTYIPTAFPTLPPTEVAEENNVQTASSSIGDIPEGVITITLLGSDERPGQGHYRTDTIILLVINPSEKTAAMVSFPRDLYIYIPGWTYQRINTAMFHGGFDLFVDTLDYNFGFRPQHYVLTNFWAFVEVVDSLGGIDIDVKTPLYDNYINFQIPVGMTHMDGETALLYARSRYSTSDFDRARRQQEVIQAILAKVMQMNVLEQSDELYEIYQDNVETDLTWGEIAPLIPLAVHFNDPARVKRYVIGRNEVTGWIAPGGAQVLLPKKDPIIAILRDALGIP